MKKSILYIALIVFGLLFLIISYFGYYTKRDIKNCSEIENCPDISNSYIKKELWNFKQIQASAKINQKICFCEKSYCNFKIIDFKGWESILDLSDNYSCLYKNASIGDSVIKEKGETFFTLVKQDGKVMKFDYECALCCGCEDTNKNETKLFGVLKFPLSVSPLLVFSPTSQE